MGRLASVEVRDERQDRISGTVGWRKKSYTLSTSGSHTLQWRYVKDDSVSSGSDCGWVDSVGRLKPSLFGESMV